MWKQTIKHVIVVSPKSGKFLKNYDTFGKMDPLVMVTIGTERHQTEVAKKQGKTPVWNSVLTYQLTEEQIKHLDRIRVEVEAFDEDPNELEFIGRKTVTLADLEPNFHTVQTMELFDGRNRSVGTVDIIFEYHQVQGDDPIPTFQDHIYQQSQTLSGSPSQKMDSSQKGKKVKSSFNPEQKTEIPTAQIQQSNKIQHLSSMRKVMYQLVITPKSGKFLKNYDMFGKMDPLVMVHIGNQKKQTETAKKQGKTPVWKTSLTFELTEEQITNPAAVGINFEAYDEDPGELEYIGRKIVTLEELEPSFGKPIEMELFDNKNKSVGTINVLVEFKETYVQVPVSQLAQHTPAYTEASDFAAPGERDEDAYNNKRSSSPQAGHKVQNPNYGYDDDYDRPYNQRSRENMASSGGLGRNQYGGGDQYYQDDYDQRAGASQGWKSREQNPQIYQNERESPQRGYEQAEKRANPQQQLRSSSPQQQMRSSSPQQQRNSSPQKVRSSSPKKPTKHAIGTVVVKPVGGRFDFGVTDQQRLHVAFIHGNTGFKTYASEGPGRRPTWRDVLSFPLMEFDDMIVRLFDDNAYYYQVLSEGVIQLGAIGRRGNFHKITVPLMSGNKKMGEVDLELEFYTDIFNNPVRIIPRIDIKRGETISKKIRYVNSDDQKKTLKIKSDNPDLVFVKTDTLNLPGNKFVEIRFKILTPKMAESKCRIDIIVQETNTIEESLLFRIRGV